MTDVQPGPMQHTFGHEITRTDIGIGQTSIYGEDSLEADQEWIKISQDGPREYTRQCLLTFANSEHSWLDSSPEGRPRPHQPDIGEVGGRVRLYRRSRGLSRAALPGKYCESLLEAMLTHNTELVPP